MFAWNVRGVNPPLDAQTVSLSDKMAILKAAILSFCRFWRLSTQSILTLDIMS